MTVAPRHPGDTRDLPMCARPPGRARVERIRDVLLVPATDERVSEDEWRDNPPAGDPAVDLGRGLSIVHRLSREENELVMHACEPRGHFFIPAFPFGVRQAYVHVLPVAEYERNPYGWDPEGTISAAYKLSRLVRDNAVSTEYSARIVDYADGQRQVIPGPVSGEWATTYRAGTGRAWLSAQDAAELRAVLDAYWSSPGIVARRLGRAVDRCEGSVHQQFAEEAVRDVVTGLEALLKTGRHQATRQFVQRVPSLARDVGISGVTQRFCEQMYRWRSQGSHGARVTMFSGAARATAGAQPAAARRTLDKVVLIQLILRAAIKRALLEPGFRRTFERPSRIRARWPASTVQGVPL
jgi:hypothetical protein